MHTKKMIIFGKNGYPVEILKEVSFPYENDSVLYIFQQADSFLLVLNVINSGKKLSKVKKDWIVYSKSMALEAATRGLLKRSSGTGVFLWILRNS